MLIPSKNEKFIFVGFETRTSREGNNTYHIIQLFNQTNYEKYSFFVNEDTLKNINPMSFSQGQVVMPLFTLGSYNNRVSVNLTDLQSA